MEITRYYDQRDVVVGHLIAIGFFGLILTLMSIDSPGDTRSFATGNPGFWFFLFLLVVVLLIGSSNRITTVDKKRKEIRVNYFVLYFVRYKQTVVPLSDVQNVVWIDNSNDESGGRGQIRLIHNDSGVNRQVVIVQAVYSTTAECRQLAERIAKTLKVKCIGT